MNRIDSDVVGIPAPPDGRRIFSQRAPGGAGKCYAGRRPTASGPESTGSGGCSIPGSRPIPAERGYGALGLALRIPAGCKDIFTPRQKHVALLLPNKEAATTDCSHISPIGKADRASESSNELFL